MSQGFLNSECDYGARIYWTLLQDRAVCPRCAIVVAFEAGPRRRSYEVEDVEDVTPQMRSARCLRWGGSC